MTLPNLITLARLFAVPGILYAIAIGQYELSFVIFVAAGVSDALDGFIAKRFDLATTLGAWLDPIADKALLVSVFVALGFQGHIPPWLVIVVVSRDLLIVGAILLARLMDVEIPVRPIFVSKINTSLQIVLMAVVLWTLGYGASYPMLVLLLSVGVVVTTVVSGVQYLVRWLEAVGTGE